MNDAEVNAAVGRRRVDRVGRLRGLSDRGTGLALFLPFVGFVLLFNLVPVLWVLWMSLQRQGLYTPDTEFVGLANFGHLLSDPRILPVLSNTVVFTIGTVTLQVLIGVAVAVLLNKAFPLRESFRGFLLFSYLVPYVVAAFAWRILFSDAVGVISFWINALSLPVPSNWLASPEWAMPAVILVHTWKNFPFMAVVFLAMLQAISSQLYEAAALDGATAWQAFRYITLPMLLPIIVIMAMLRTIWNFNNFEVVFLLTGGGPVGSTETLPLYIYRLVFGEMSVGRGTAAAVLVMVFLLVFSVVYFIGYKWATQRLG